MSFKTGCNTSLVSEFVDLRNSRQTVRRLPNAARDLQIQGGTKKRMSSQLLYANEWVQTVGGKQTSC